MAVPTVAHSSPRPLSIYCIKKISKYDQHIQGYLKVLMEKCNRYFLHDT